MLSVYSKRYYSTGYLTYENPSNLVFHKEQPFKKSTPYFDFFDCIGILENCAESAGLNDGQGFIYNSKETEYYEGDLWREAFLMYPFNRLLLMQGLSPGVLREKGKNASNSIDINIVNSWDPNDKAGPSGYGEFGYVPSYQPFYYMIHFENVDTATTSAQNIILTDTLNPNLDWTTLVFDTTSHIPTSQTFDPVTGIIEWKFEGINLPPNVTPPEGEGWILFHLDQLPNLTSGTQITNRASIKFDYNDPMLTGTVLNTIDAGYPNSSVNTNPVHIDSTKYLITWSGQADSGGSGIRDYTIYYKLHPDSNYRPWLRNIAENSAEFIGEYEKTYYFYSIARDGVGYLESPPDSYDLALNVTFGVEENELHNPNSLKIYPNPFTDKTTIEFSNPNHTKYKLTVYCLYGNKVLELDNIKSNKIELEKGNLSRGVYIIELKGEKIFENKMIIIK